MEPPGKPFSGNHSGTHKETILRKPFRKRNQESILRKPFKEPPRKPFSNPQGNHSQETIHWARLAPNPWNPIDAGIWRLAIRSRPLHFMAGWHRQRLLSLVPSVALFLPLVTHRQLAVAVQCPSARPQSGFIFQEFSVAAHCLRGLWGSLSMRDSVKSRRHSGLQMR